MAIDCTLYQPRSGSWAVFKSTKGNLKQTDHAEILALKAFSAREGHGNPCLLVQNAFPCDHCHTAMLERTKGGTLSVIVKVTENKGAYSACHSISGVQLGQRGSIPCIIYYHAGQCRYSNMTLAMKNGGTVTLPAGFPDHPDFDHL